MHKFIESIMPIIRIIFPEQRKWVARVLILAGIPMAASPVWEPYAVAAFSKYLNVSVVTNSATITGWVFLVVGLVVVVVNEYIDRRPALIKISPQDVSDKKYLDELFSEFHIPTAEKFFHFGKLSITYDPIFNYFYGMEAHVNSPQNHLHDDVVKNEIMCLYQALKKALSYGEYFVDMPNPNLHKFDSRRDIYADADAKAAHDGFVDSIYLAEESLKKICEYVLNKYPDFDFVGTNKIALERNKKYQSLTDEV